MIGFSSVARGGVMGHLQPPRPKLLSTRYNLIFKLIVQKGKIKSDF